MAGTGWLPMSPLRIELGLDRRAAKVRLGGPRSERGIGRTRPYRPVVSRGRHQRALRMCRSSVGAQELSRRARVPSLTAAAISPNPITTMNPGPLYWRPTTWTRCQHGHRALLSGVPVFMQKSCKSLADVRQSLEAHFRTHAAAVERFRGANANEVVRMWRTGTNEKGEPLSSFEREALIERHCELFGHWPD